MGYINIKDHLSPAQAKTRIELGKKLNSKVIYTIHAQ